MKQKLITSLPVIFLKPGECHFSSSPELVLTILGSCVAIIMYNTDRRISAMSHCILPVFSRYEEEKGNPFKFIDSSFTEMLKFFKDQKIPASQISIKLFGGAEQLVRKHSENQSVGKQNIDMAVSICQRENLNIVSMDVGGTGGRKIYLSSQSGEVLLARLGNIKIIRLNKLHEKN